MTLSGWLFLPKYAAPTIKPFNNLPIIDRIIWLAVFFFSRCIRCMQSQWFPLNYCVETMSCMLYRQSRVNIFLRKIRVARPICRFNGTTQLSDVVCGQIFSISSDFLTAEVRTTLAIYAFYTFRMQTYLILRSNKKNNNNTKSIKTINFFA